MTEEKKGNFDYARQILTAELFKLGGEMFSLAVLEMQALNNPEVRRQLDAHTMMKKVIGQRHDPDIQREKYYMEIAEALQLLNDSQQTYRWPGIDDDPTPPDEQQETAIKVQQEVDHLAGCAIHAGGECDCFASDLKAGNPE